MRSAIAALLGFCICVAAGCGRGPGRQPPGPSETPQEHVDFYVFYAASLARAFQELERKFETLHPEVDVLRESSGSQTAIRKVTQLNREADIVVSADYTVIRDLMMPEHATWQILFARNSIVIAYTDKSRYADQIDGHNWYKILTKQEVLFGRANPNLAPVGYRTLQTWELADLHYKDRVGRQTIYEALMDRCPDDCQRTVPDVEQLIGPLESMGLDYAFVYENVAKQHNLPYVTLPEEIDLRSERHEELYRQVSTRITGKKRGEFITQVGRPIVYGITIPVDAPHPALGVEFLKLLFSEVGEESLGKGFVTPITPPLTPDVSAIPQELRGLVQEAKF
jgi:molybdate/tungstate transport system substrate-binding protein